MSNTANEVALRESLAELVKAAQRLNEAAAQISKLNLVRPIVGQVSEQGAAVSGSLLGLTPDQRLICERIINVFETGSIQGDYSNISIYADGPHRMRQVTYGRAQTTEYGNLRELVQMYAGAGGVYSNDLREFVDRIGTTPLVDNARFKDLLRRAGAQDQVMRDTQDVFFDRRYFQPAKQWADTCGFTRALSMLVIYDSFIHSGGILDFLRSRFPEPIPARGGHEQTWIKQYVDVRHNWLLNNDNPALHPTVYRTRDLAREIARGNWDLAMLPISAHGVPVDARPITPHMAASAEIPAGVPYFPDGSSQAKEGIQASGEILVDNPFAGAADVADDSDPAAPGPGEADDPARQRELANFGEDGNLDLSPLAGVAATASPLLMLDMSRARAFLQACMTSTPRVTYGLGAKVPFFGAVPGRDFQKIDCSGFVREAIRRATTPPLAFPDGSVNQHDWIRGHGFARSSIDAAKQSDDFVRIAFLRPQDSPKRIGHVVLISGARTLESHGGVGPDTRRWDGSGWQAKAFVYVLAREAAVVTAGGAPMFAAGAAAAVAEARSFTVRHGRRYRATLALSWLEQLIGNANTIIADKLKQAGFRDVVVTGNGATRYAEGTWNGADTTAPLDSHIISVVELATAAMSLGQLV